MKLLYKKLLGVLGVISALLGVLVLPILVGRYTGIDTISAAFAVIVLYAALSWWMRRNPKIQD